MRIFVKGTGLAGPGLENWNQAKTILCGEAPYIVAPLARPNPQVLTGELRRRSGNHIRLAVQAASEAVANAESDPRALASVFATAEGDTEITNYICDAVAQPAPALSPTRFHNSVTNAPAGYWSMAVSAMAPSTAVSGHDSTFAVGLIEACVQANQEQRDILLVAHDMEMPPPLAASRSLPWGFAVAFVLSLTPSAGAAALTLTVGPAEPETVCDSADLESIRCGNPAARALPLLIAVARRAPARIALPYVDDCAVLLEIADADGR